MTYRLEDGLASERAVCQRKMPGKVGFCQAADGGHRTRNDIPRTVSSSRSAARNARSLPCL